MPVRSSSASLCCFLNFAPYSARGRFSLQGYSGSPHCPALIYALRLAEASNHGLTGVFPHSNVNIPTGANPRQLGFPPAGAAGTDNAGGDETRPVNVYTVIAIKAV